MKKFLVLLKIEAKMVCRGIDTIFFGIGFPIVVVFFMGILMKDGEVLNQSFSAVSTIGICATGLMGIPLTIADYRYRNILKRYSVTPLSPFLILLVQVLINFVISLISLLAVYLIMAYGFHFTFTGEIMPFLCSFVLIAFAIYGFGMMIASVSPNIKTANLLCTLIYFPMIFLSGTVIPYDVMPEFLQNIMDFSPLKHGIDLMNHFALGINSSIGIPIICLSVMGIVCSLLSLKNFHWV